MNTWNPEEYHRYSSEQQKWARELISKLHLNGTERVLDIGCGDGKVTAEIARHLPFGFILGIDNSHAMIQFAKMHFPPAVYPNLAFQQMDARNLQFHNEFDVVFSNATLHWVKDHLSVLHGIRKSLKPKGRILLQMGGKGNARPMIETIENVISQKEWASYFQDFVFPWGFYGKEEYALWLKEAGLKPKRIELIPKEMIHNGVESLSGWLRTTWFPYLERVPEAKRERFLNEVVNCYVNDYPPDSQGNIHVPMMRLEVEAEKDE